MVIYRCLYLSFLVPSGPFPILAGLDCERMDERPRSKPATSPCPPQATPSLPSSVLYYECGITLQRTFGLINPPQPNQYHLPLPFLVSSALLASVSLNITTHCTLLAYLSAFPPISIFLSPVLHLDFTPPTLARTQTS